MSNHQFPYWPLRHLSKVNHEWSTFCISGVVPDADSKVSLRSRNDLIIHKLWHYLGKLLYHLTYFLALGPIAKLNLHSKLRNSHNL